MKRLLVILFLTTQVHAATTESLIAMSSSLQIMGPNGPIILLREYHQRLEGHPDFNGSEELVALRNMVDFCTSPPIMANTYSMYDYARLEVLSEKELKLVAEVAEEAVQREIDAMTSHMIDRMNKIKGIWEGAAQAIGRITW